MRVDFRDVLFWIFLILGMILLLWNVFGDSATEFIALATLIFTVLLKTWSISDRQIRLEMRFNALEKSFVKLSNDFKAHVTHK